MLAALLNNPKDDNDWQIWSYNHRDSHDRIRKAIYEQTGNIQSITVTNEGSGYTSIPTIAVTGGNGYGVQINVTITGGKITSLAVVNGGVQYVNPVIVISGGGGTGATATATASAQVNLTDYVIDPIDQDNIDTFLNNNQSLHSDMDGVLGVQSSDLQDVDFKDENARIAWFYSHYLEHYDVETALGI